MLFALLVAAAASAAPAVAGSVTVTPGTVPAGGAQEATLQVGRTAMVRLGATSAQGTRCEIVDRLRGPFASAGEAGKSDCALALLLDAGTYKVRLWSPPAGRGVVRLTAGEFTEVHAPALALPEGGSHTRPLRAGEQASYWIEVPEKRRVHLRVQGRTAGRVELWRGGEWREQSQAQGGQVLLAAHRPVHEWWIEPELAAGRYRLTVYGVDPLRWASGGETDLLHVESGFPTAGARALDVTLPAWGTALVQAPFPSAVAFLTRTSASEGETSLFVRGLRPGAPGYQAEAGEGEACFIGPKALVPACAVRSAEGPEKLLVVRGLPGTQVQLRWARSASGLLLDGEVDAPAPTVSFRAPADGSYLVGVHDVPGDPDAPPLSCVLAERVGGSVVARDLLHLGADGVFDRAFNYDGGEAAIWFEVDQDGDYTFAARGGRKSRCELFALDAEHGRLTDSAREPGCRMTRALRRGAYELKLYGGVPGVEDLRIARAGAGARRTATKSACLFPGVDLRAGDGGYTLSLNRAGSAAARGLVLRPLPLQLDEPLELDPEPGRTLRLPLARGDGAEVRSAGAAPFSCAAGAEPMALARGGGCAALGSGPSSLRLAALGSEPVTLFLRRAVPAALPKPLVGSALAPVTLPRLPLGQEVWLDFGREETHALVFEATEPALYQVTTTGLLATACALRTEALPELVADAGGGRGRNCLAAAFLRPGRYLVTLTTEGQSRGRAGVRMTRRAPVPAGVLGVGQQVFFRAEAGDLVQQRLVVAGPEGATHGAAEPVQVRVETTALGAASLACRLDDADGWPVVAVPAPCASEHALRPGTYGWSQLPLTVATSRQSRLAFAAPPFVFAGDEVRALALNQVYDARLGPRGQDVYRFALEAELDVSFELSNGMQGRLLGADDPADAPPRAFVPAAAAGGPAGHRVHLAAGAYRLLAEHSQADVAIQYSIAVSVAVLSPGQSRTLDVPLRTTLRMPRAGTLRLQTQGELEVRCRVLDARGELLAASERRGADWNCALAAPLPAGDLTLVVESATLQPGQTRVSLSLAQVPSPIPGRLGESALDLSSAIETVALPPTPAGTLLRVAATTDSGGVFCALEPARRGGPAGAGSDAPLAVGPSPASGCDGVLQARGEPYALRLWTLRGSAARVTLHLALERVVVSGDRVPRGGGVSAQVGRAGRYQTTAPVLCLPARESGPLRDCGREISLTPEPWTFALRDPAAEVELRLRALVPTLRGEQRELLDLGPRPYLARHRSDQPALQLLGVQGPPGGPAALSCDLSGVQVQRASACFAAAGLTSETLARIWVPGAGETRADATWLALAPPARAGLLGAGRHDLRWEGPVGRFALPRTPVRVDLTLPRDAWAVLLDARGAAVDLCAPNGPDAPEAGVPHGAPALARCVLAANAGELLLYAPSESRAAAQILGAPAPRAAQRLDRLYEERAPESGGAGLVFDAASEERALDVQGALACVVALSDGSRTAGCQASVPAHLSGRVEVQREVGTPWRAVLRGAAETARADGSAALELEREGPAETLGAAQFLPLRGAQAVRRTLAIDQPAFVHVHADAGVCGLFVGGRQVAGAGLGGGCDLRRLVPAGAALLAVRPFAGEPLQGTVWWTREPVEPLGEGVGPEAWIAPGDARLFQFATRSDGEVGLGLRVATDALECDVLDDAWHVRGSGCQQLLSLPAGTYWLSVRAPAAAEARALRFRPVLRGLQGAQRGVPQDVLRDLFQRIGGEP